MASQLVNWIRRNKPARLRIRTEDGEERTIEVDEKASNRWRAAADAVESCRAVHVEALNKDDGIIRTCEHEPADVVDQASSDEKRDKARAAERKAIVSELAQVIRETGIAQKDCFHAGVEAMRTALECVIEQNRVQQTLTTELANHLTVALTNVHNLSVQYANAIQQIGEGEGNSRNEMMTEVLGAVATRALGMNGEPAKPPKGAKAP